VPNDTPSIDLVYDCPHCGERVEVIGISWPWLDGLMLDVVDKPNKAMHRCQYYMIQFALLLLLDQQQLTVWENASATIVIKEIDARKRSIEATTGSEVQSLPAGDAGQTADPTRPDLRT
jgi:hypothetical protein